MLRPELDVDGQTHVIDHNLKASSDRIYFTNSVEHYIYGTLTEKRREKII